MIKVFVAAAAALMLAGCANVDLFGDPWGDDGSAAQPVAADAGTADTGAGASVSSAAPSAAEAEPPAVSAARERPPSPATSARCTRLARLRAGDAAFQGEDPETQEAVFKTTYRDCVAWDAAHRS
ncbi:MAG TPA: hypothetical protein VG819_09330 [Rhizomicrobium sp.]|jgi:hypothetical protein|nr:hypothetical protein [Rhizomicrobium sp.]